MYEQWCGHILNNCAIYSYENNYKKCMDKYSQKTTYGC